MRMKKRAFGIILSICMLCGLLPTTAFAVSCDTPDCSHVAAIGDEHFDSVSDAVAAAEAKDIIMVIKDHDVTCTGNWLTIAEGTDVTIDLNGKVINVTSSATGNIYFIQVYGKLKLTDTSRDQTGKIDAKAAQGNANLNLLRAQSGSKVVIESGIYCLDRSTDGCGMIDSRVKSHEEDQVPITVTGGTFRLSNLGSASNGSPWIFNASGQNEGGIIVTGGTFNADIAHEYYPFEVQAPKEKALRKEYNSTFGCDMWTMVDAAAYVGEQEFSGMWYTNDVGYETLAEAIISAHRAVDSTNREIPPENRMPITLLADCHVDHIQITKDVPINLNGKKILWDGNISDPVITVSEGGTLTIEEPVVIKDGYSFQGWYKDAAFTTPFSFEQGGPTIIEGNTTLYLKPKYSISYSLNGGTVDGANPTEYMADSADITLVNPTKPGYTFAGWTGTDLTEPTMTVTIPKGSAGNRTYTASWTPVAYTITYEDAEAGGNPTEYTVESADITLVNPSKTGYTFAGWTGTDLDEPAMEVTIPAGSTGNRTYIAGWTPAQLNGTVTITGTVQVGETLTATVSDSNNTGTLSYKWYRHAEDSVLMEESASNVYVIPEDAIAQKIYCVVSSSVQTDSIESDPVGPVPLLTFPENSISAENYTGVYDGQAHGIVVTAPEGAAVYYGTDGETYQLNACPAYTDAGAYTVYYRVVKANYADVTGSALVNITEATPTVTAWPTVNGPIYVNDTGVTLNSDGTAVGINAVPLDGSFILSAVDVTSAGTRPVTITFVPTDSTNYNSVEQNDFLVTVVKRTAASVEPLDSIANKLYGTAQADLGLPTGVTLITVDGKSFSDVPVSWSGYSADDLDAQTLTGTLDLSSIAAEVEQPATAVTASVVVDLQEKDAAAFSFAPKTATYSGSPIPHTLPDELDGVVSIAYSYVGINGTDYAASADAPISAGSYEVTATFTMKAGYADVDPKTAALTIEPKEISLDWSDFTADALVYSGTAKTMTVTAANLVNGDSCTITAELVGSNVNVGTFSYKVTALNNPNYKLPAAVESPEYTITAKPVTITADDQSVYAGSAAPELTYTVEGLVGSDALITEPVRTTNANLYGAGTYTITISGADAGSNYNITYVNGTFTVMDYVDDTEPTYGVDLPDDPVGGKVSANRKNPCAGDIVTLAVVPDDGYELNELTVTSGSGRTVELTKVSETKYTFHMPGSAVTIHAVFAEKAPIAPIVMPFTDVAKDFWGYDEILWAHQNGYVNGTTETTFTPNGNITRQQIWMILARMSGVQPADMDAARTWAMANGITDGSNPTAAVTREQMVTLLYRYAKLMGHDADAGDASDLIAYTDTASISEYAVEAFRWACGEDIVNGTTPTTLSPSGTATRAQFAAILFRFAA